jgi:hypothetical protein
LTPPRLPVSLATVLALIQLPLDIAELSLLGHQVGADPQRLLQLWTGRQLSIEAARFLPAVLGDHVPLALVVLLPARYGRRRLVERPACMHEGQGGRPKGSMRQPQEAPAFGMQQPRSELAMPLVVVTVCRAQREGAWDLCSLNDAFPGTHNRASEPRHTARVIATTWGLPLSPSVTPKPPHAHLMSCCITQETAR